MRKSQKCPTNRLVVGPPRPSMKFRLPGIKSGLFIPCLFWALFTFLASPSSIRAAAWNIETVEAPSTGGVGYPSIALDAAGRPHISYSAPQGSGSVLKLASKLDSSWSSQTADPDANVVGWTSLKLYKDEPRISYYDHSDFVEGRLKFAYRNGSVWTNQIVDEEYMWTSAGRPRWRSMPTGNPVSPICAIATTPEKSFMSNTAPAPPPPTRSHTFPPPPLKPAPRSRPGAG